MTTLAVRCILCDMDENPWTEQQMIAYVKSHGCPAFDARQLKRYRLEKVVQVEREYPEFGGSRTIYPPEAGPRAVAVYHLLREKRSFNVVRFRLWQCGYAMDLSLLKQSLLALAPLPAIQVVRRNAFIERHVHDIIQRLDKLVRYSEWRTVLRRLPREEDRRDFLTIHLSWMTGAKYVFEPYQSDAFPEELTSAEVFKRGLRLEEATFLPEDPAVFSADLTRFSQQHLLSITKFQEDLAAATEAELRLANDGLDLIELLAQLAELTGGLFGPPQLYRVTRSPRFQAFALLFLLRLNTCGYGDNIQALLAVLHIQIPVLQRHQTLSRLLRQELPSLAKELPSLRQISRFTPQQQEAAQARLGQMYQDNKAAIDAFMQRHPELLEQQEQVVHDTVSPP